jgi:hypothetical protein
VNCRHVSSGCAFEADYVGDETRRDIASKFAASTTWLSCRGNAAMAIHAACFVLGAVAPLTIVGWLLGFH